MFRHSRKSYRDLPIRFADFGVLHRNEISGSLTGLTRVRRFQQDDAHIYCRIDQIEEEVRGCLAFLQHVYGIFEFKFELELSTRSDEKIGDDSVWDMAESTLAKVMTEFCNAHPEIKPWEENPGDAAFYGPKIDIGVFDCMGRKFQCATIQLDFQMPMRFELKYATADNKNETPVMVHRAILGSVERFTAILLEHTAGKLPFWVSPRQVVLVPVAADQFEYARDIAQQLVDEGFYADVDDSNDRFKKKLRNNTLIGYNVQLVVGPKEVAAGAVNVRLRNGEEHGVKSFAECKAWLHEINDTYSNQF